MSMKLSWEDTIENRAVAVVGCWVEDCVEADEPPDLSPEQLEMLTHQVETGLFAQRTEYHVED